MLSQSILEINKKKYFDFTCGNSSYLFPTHVFFTACLNSSVEMRPSYYDRRTKLLIVNDTNKFKNKSSLLRYFRYIFVNITADKLFQIIIPTTSRQSHRQFINFLKIIFRLQFYSAMNIRKLCLLKLNLIKDLLNVFISEILSKNYIELYESCLKT